MPPTLRTQMDQRMPKKGAIGEQRALGGHEVGNDAIEQQAHDLLSPCLRRICGGWRRRTHGPVASWRSDEPRRQIMPSPSPSATLLLSVQPQYHAEAAIQADSYASEMQTFARRRAMLHKVAEKGA
jgi:hypothetical protein